MREIPILHRDDHLVVVDKPAGILVVEAPGRRGPTLVDALTRQLGVRVQAVHPPLEGLVLKFLRIHRGEVVEVDPAFAVARGAGIACFARSTAGIVGAADIARMKRSAYLINTSRPALIDQPALIAALSERRIAGAGLDVYDIEPLPIEHPYRSLPTVLATPHIGFVTEENHRIFYEQSLENAKAWLAGAPIRVVNGAVASELIK